MTLRQQASMVAFEKVFLTMGVTPPPADALSLLPSFPLSLIFPS